MASVVMARHRAAAIGRKKTHKVLHPCCVSWEKCYHRLVCVPLPSPGKTGNGSLPVVEKGAIKFYEGP